VPPPPSRVRCSDRSTVTGGPAAPEPPPSTVRGAAESGAADNGTAEPGAAGDGTAESGAGASGTAALEVAGRTPTGSEVTGPLTGLVVADFSRILAGPYATMLLADLGGGCSSRRCPPPRAGEWFDRFRAKGLPGGPVNTVPEGIAFAESVGLDPVVEVGDGAHAIPSVRNPITFSATPPSYGHAPPTLDEHGDEIRDWLRAPRD
jgi:hypothetical protein